MVKTWRSPFEPGPQRQAEVAPLAEGFGDHPRAPARQAGRTVAAKSASEKQEDGRPDDPRPVASQGSETHRLKLAQARLKALAAALYRYAGDHDGFFPPSLAELVDRKYISAKDIASVGEPAKPIVYVAGLDAAAEDEMIVAHDPAPCKGKQMVVLRVDTKVATVKSQSELARLLAVQKTRRAAGR